VLAAALQRLDGEAEEAIADVRTRFADRRNGIERFITAYRHYCWPVASLDDLKLAPFSLLASEGTVHVHQNHVWHMERLAVLCDRDPKLLRATPFRLVDVTDPASEQAGIDWWEELTGRGGEGMVVKPLEFVMRGKKGLVQPAVKCRGREYLR